MTWRREFLPGEDLLSYPRERIEEAKPLPPAADLKMRPPPIERRPHDFMGLMMAQNGYALNAFVALFKQHRPARVIELGTWKGGLSLILDLCCKAMGARFVTYDWKDLRQHKELFDLLGTDYRHLDFYTDPELPEMLSAPGLTVLLIDGGNKPKEYRTFVPYLKSGDIVLAHDYARDLQHQCPFWAPHVEISDEMIEDVEGPVPYMRATFDPAAWLCRRMP